MTPDFFLATQPCLTRSAALQWARQLIDRLDARLLLAFVTGDSAAELLAYSERVLSEAQAADFASLVQRRAAGEPVAYLTEEAGFFGLLLQVSPAVLVPRPETEELVAWALTLLQGHAAPRIADLGTGSGAIALALADARPDAQILAIDVSPDAVAVAQANRDRLDLPNVDMRCASWFDDVSEEAQFDLIVSNPPYIADSERKAMEPNVLDYEPATALFVPDADPLRFYRAIARYGLGALRQNGRLYFEINSRFSAEMRQMLETMGYADVDVRPDISRRPRFMRAVKGGDQW